VEAEEGDADAMYVIGSIYRFQEDYSVAKTWYRRAADQGHTEAMDTIGLDYYHGYGVPENLEKAIEWLEKAANLGHQRATETLRKIRKETK